MSGVDILLLGGSPRAGSVSAQVLAVCADLVGRHGARVTVLPASELVLPLYDPGTTQRTPEAQRLVSAARRADGVIVATPTYHGGMSGLLKNALDYLEDLANDTPAYLDGRAVGAVAVGWSEHGAASAVADVRNTVMCLRGWTTPMAVTISAAGASALEDDVVRSDPRAMRRLEILVGQVVDFALRSDSDRLMAGV